VELTRGALVWSLPWAAILLALTVATDLSFQVAVVAWLLGALLCAGVVVLRRRRSAALARWLDGLVTGVDVPPPPHPDDGILGTSLLRARRWIMEQHRRERGFADLEQAMLDAIPDPLIVVGERAIVRHVNAAARAEIPRAEPGGPLSRALRDPGLLAAVEDALLHGEASQLALDIPGERRRAFRVQVAGFGEPGGGRGAIVGLRERTEEMAIERIRSDFVANASHEIRTPLAAIRGFAETLQGTARDDPEAQARFLAIMVQESERLSRLVEDLLTLSRVELQEHQKPTELVAIGDVLESVRHALDSYAAERESHLEVTVAADLPPVRGDRDQLHQLFSNLFDNAIKYGKPGAPVTIRAAAVDNAPPGAGPLTGREALAVSVTDRGKGIPRDAMPRLTERFYRVEKGRSRELGGTGLGLAIVKHVLARHEGHLAIESEAGRGSTFTVYLPLPDGPHQS
jgi:two-component system phosphate regulon sensor histidine kinase PhoR